MKLLLIFRVQLIFLDVDFFAQRFFRELGALCWSRGHLNEYVAVIAVIY